MIFAAGFGLGLGTIAGISIGPQIFSRVLATPKNYAKQLSEAADEDWLSEPPEMGAAVTSEMRDLLQYTEPWTINPDYERVSMINRVLAVMWPTLTKAIMVEVIKGVRPALEKQVFTKFKFIEDIVLGTASMRDAGTWESWIKDKDFTIGTIPPRIGGIKCYDTSHDEVILEIPLVWGSNCKFDIGVFLRAGPFRIYVPIEVSNLHLKVETRITIKPLVDEVPCVGGANVTLLKTPHVDLTLKLLKGVDLLALPIIQDGLRFAIQHVLNGILIYPNSLSFPIMPNFGIPPPPKGCLNIKLLKGDGIKGGDELYVRLAVREGRSMVSTTVKNDKSTNFTPTWNQEFNLVVDDFEKQTLQLTVIKDDFGWNDTKLVVGTLAFGERLASALPARALEGQPDADEFTPAEFIRSPMTEIQLALPLVKYIPKDSGLLTMGVKSFAKVGSFAAGSVGSVFKMGSKKGADYKVENYGNLYLKATFMPFLQPSFDDEDEEVAAKKKAAKPLPPRPTGRVVNSNIADHVKGVLTVQLIRCINLMGTDPNTYVRMLASDEESDVDQEQKSSPVFSENSPRWNDKFDFVMITAGSVLHITVYDRASLASSFLTTVNVFGKKKEDDKDKVLGKLQIPVKDVARNGMIKDLWTLQDTERGQIELALHWQTIEVPDSL